jgi:hypothetical protein
MASTLSGPLPLWWYSGAVTENPDAKPELDNMMAALFNHGSALTPDYLLVMLSVLLQEPPVDIPAPGCFAYRAELGTGGLLIPVSKVHRAYLDDNVLVDDVTGLISWFLIYFWFQHMLARMIFGQPGSEIKVVSIEKYAMAYANAACMMLETDQGIAMTNLDALKMTSTWSDDIPSPPWEFLKQS